MNTSASSSIRRIGVLTGGGDCPGLNAVLRAVTKTAIFQHNLEVLGIEDGFLGLLEDRVRPLDSDDVSGILTTGGTILGANNRCDPRKFCTGKDARGNPTFADRSGDCLATIERHRLDAVMVVGGDGTMSCAAPLIRAGVNCIGIPKTIDNDIIGTDITFGFTTAYTTATLALDRLHSTAASHHRVMVCEVMGRNAGWLALHAGVASGSDVILIPEIPYDIDKVCRFVESRKRPRAGFSMVVVAEGAKSIGGAQTVAHHDPTRAEPVRLGGIGQRLTSDIEQGTGIETRTTVLGHVVRGGAPVAADRVLATQFGHRAVEMLMRGEHGRMVVKRRGELDHVDLLSVIDQQRLVPVDHPLIAAARAVKTSFGD